jgi:monoterpene epsilon-lactone hydrolase
MPSTIISTYPFADWVSSAAKERFTMSVEGAVAPPGALASTRAHYDRINTQRLDVAHQNFSVEIENSVLDGVPVAIVTPTVGVTDDCILLCLHGGAFMWGAGAGALIEAIPLAAVARRTVVAVDYRLAPEHLYPAAGDDVIACYKALLRQRDASTIGIYGCSAGGVLTAHAVTQLITEGVPRPAAIAMLHATGLELGGDSVGVASQLNGIDEPETVPSLGGLPYLAQADPCDPLVFPGNHPEILAQFPPTLLISGTRDFAASSVSTMHRRLLSAGADTELVMFDGMWHAHHVDTDLPESGETFSIMARFFADHLKS